MLRPRRETATGLLLAVTQVSAPQLVPELRVRVADQLMPTWEAAEKHLGHMVAPPFWAFVWPGSHALARLLLDRPDLVAGRSVFDFASGCGLAAIAAVRAGAARVVACDLDPLAAEAQRMNAELNGVAIESVVRDPVGRPLAGFDVVLAGDVCYERGAAQQITRWLRGLARAGALVLLADPGRVYAPDRGIQPIERYDIPTSRELESADIMRTTIWQLT